MRGTTIGAAVVFAAFMGLAGCNGQETGQPGGMQDSPPTATPAPATGPGLDATPGAGPGAMEPAFGAPGTQHDTLGVAPAPGAPGAGTQPGATGRP